MKLPKINWKYIFFIIFIIGLAALDAIRDYTDMSRTWRDIWHWVKRFSIFNVALIFLWDELVNAWHKGRKLSFKTLFRSKYFKKQILYPFLWLAIMAFFFQVWFYNWLWGAK